MKWAPQSSVRRYGTLFLLVTALAAGAAAKPPPESVCYGSVSNGRIKHSVWLPKQGDNFSTYSDFASNAGRTFVHSRVAAALLTSYQAAHKTLPDVRYVYGETGWQAGGRFRPHRTHQNGLSVDFFMPVRNAAGQSVHLPMHLGNRYGYDIEFDAQGRYQNYRIDFPALAEHLYQLDQAARVQQAPIKLVILDPVFYPALFATPRGEYLRQQLPFMKGKPWVRHDEHYHVDFDVPCKPLGD